MKKIINMKKIFGFNKIIILLLFLCSSYFSKELYVKNTFELTKILQKIENYDKIFLKSGIYIGNFIIDKNIEIYGDGYVILTSNSKKNILTINSKKVKIKNIHFYNSGKNITENNSCLLIKSNKAIIINNFFSECAFSIWIKAGNYNYITKNIFLGTKNKFLSDRGNTIHIYKSLGTIINNNFIVNNRDGIYITNSKEVSIINNCFLNVRFGIHYMFSDKCNVISNSITESLIGIAIMYSKYVDLANNLSYSNIDHGLFFRDVLYSRIIRNKSLYNNTSILIGNSYFNDIINNDIIKNNIGIKVYSGSDENLIYDNNFITNRLQVQFLDNDKLIWNSKNIGNFWSHYLGWDWNLDNIGDNKFYVTNINDWLLFSYPLLNIMFKSPAIVLLQKIENQFPTFRKYSIIDKYPIMSSIIW